MTPRNEDRGPLSAPMRSFVFGIATTKLEMPRSPPLSMGQMEQVEPISSSKLCYCRSLLRD
jgi:hypothetical protein